MFGDSNTNTQASSAAFFKTTPPTICHVSLFHRSYLAKGLYVAEIVAAFLTILFQPFSELFLCIIFAIDNFSVCIIFQFITHVHNKLFIVYKKPIFLW